VFDGLKFAMKSRYSKVDLHVDPKVAKYALNSSRAECYWLASYSR
jgi:hypothetical protein